MTLHAPTHEMAPERFVLRAARPDDLDALERMARASAAGITTLPPDRAALEARLKRSTASFASADQPSGEELYVFVLEDTARSGSAAERLVGTAAITAGAGFADRFYCYRNETLVHTSAALHARNRVHTLHLCHALTGATLLSSFFIEPAYEQTLAPQLLSRARLLFIAEFAERFSDHIASESPGLADSDGRCPFWDAVGRRFFDMDYPQVERLAMGRSKAFIAELLPQSPVYVPLLPEEAQWAIGQLNPVAEVPFAILMDEGFESETYVDVFDGGPIVDARRASLRTVAQSRAAPAEWDEPEPAGPWHLVASTRREGFRAVLARARWARGHWRLSPADAGRLALPAGSERGTRLRAAPLAQGPLGAEGAPPAPTATGEAA
jgi:arginine N-succinyltransferase